MGRKVVKKDKRMHICVSKEAGQIVRAKADALGMTYSDYIIDKALSFKIDDVPKKLDTAIRKLGTLVPQDILQNITEDVNNKMQQFAENFKEQCKIARGKTMKDNNNIGQFHLRTEAETFEKIKKKAKSLSMSISDYVAFTTTQFDVLEISKKIDMLNALIDNLVKTAKNEKGA